jgi:hypothetical protein
MSGICVSPQVRYFQASQFVCETALPNQPMVSFSRRLIASDWVAPAEMAIGLSSSHHE